MRPLPVNVAEAHAQLDKLESIAMKDGIRFIPSQAEVLGALKKYFVPHVAKWIALDQIAMLYLRLELRSYRYGTEHEGIYADNGARGRIWDTGNTLALLSDLTLSPVYFWWSCLLTIEQVKAEVGTSYLSEREHLDISRVRDGRYLDYDA